MRKILSVLLCAALFLLGIGVAGTASAQKVSAATTDYYSGITAEKGTALLGQLHDLIVDTHKTYSSYDDCKSKAYLTDPSENGILEFYTHETYPNNFGSSTGVLNREHVWPKSLGHWNTSNAGSDLHHIRPTEYTTNNARGNDKYGEVSGGTAVHSSKGGLAGYHTGGVYEPNDNVKGDAARIVMYVYTHYNTASRVYGTKESKGSGALSFTNIMSASSESAAIELLLEWNELDPVDEIERTRNEAVYKIQGNRNPFIDNETYANAIWGDGTAVGGGGGTDVGGGGTTTPTETFHPITEPEEGTYYLGMNVNGTYYYAQSSLVNNYYISTTTDINSASEYTLTKQGDGWIIKTGSKFLELPIVTGTDSKQHANPKFNSTQTSGKTWAWDASNKIFTWTDNNDTAFLGNYGGKTNIAGAFITYINSDYPAQLGTYGTQGGSQGGGTEHTHTYRYQDLNDTYHTVTCSGCSEVNRQEAHVYTDAQDTTCNLCNHVRTIGGGTQGGGTGKITITLDSFTMHDGYDFQDWSSGGVSGVAYIYGGNVNYPDSPVTDLQFSKPTTGRSYYLANTTAVPGPITSITVKSAQYSNNWTVLTSDTSFGEVVGYPSGGTNQGQKQVPTEGVTWQIDGDDTYFAIQYDTTEYAGHLVSIEITYATNGSQGGGQSGSEGFHTAVEAIVSEGSLEARAASLNNAIAAYKTLSEAERSAAAADVQKLEAAIAAYNETVRKFNATASGREGLALQAAGCMLN